MKGIARSSSVLTLNQLTNPQSIIFKTILGAAMSSPMPVSSIPECIKAIQPDSNGWVPPGTCGYYGKMYYPSFIAAAVFSIIAGAMLLGHLIQAIRYSNSRLQRFAVSVSTCLFTGYVARAVGTRHQQNIYIAAFSDTMVLVSPICKKSLQTPKKNLVIHYWPLM